ncbi:H-NS histone family protein [Bradyrhizobium sp. BR13661]|jgi:DNA-binding protein H-NS|uniref:H-NS histone family protein n=1 Tax=Bradyrhizobium sp. BR13661 TaxID=2940622 RepID=UPI00247423B3|nr:H-NS histone family protein [Bradyrhizobium sp. BR13661]MDH6257737.1 DNA-binding protein H-NS [Bradyrhizobium sp. BR13661]
MLKQQILGLSADELWHLYQEVQVALIAKMRAQMLEIDRRLNVISQGRHARGLPLRSPAKTAKRKGARLAPKFRNPDDPTQTWAGRGLQPKWLKQAMRNGKGLDEFAIRQDSTTETKNKRGRPRPQIRAVT